MKHGLTVLAALCLLALPATGAEIRWEPFALTNAPAGITAQLGHLITPLIHARPEAGSVDLAFVRLQSATKSSAIPIVYLAGGPGDDAISTTRFPPALQAMARLAGIADVVLLDQRGTGRSTPRPVCRAPRVPEPAERFAPPDHIDAMMKELASRCVAEWAAKGVDARGFTNAESAADLDDLRRALGVPRISLLGYSYGTHLALAAIRAHGDTIERAVLIGTEGPNDTRKPPWSLDVQLGKLSLLAGHDMTSQLRRILTRLDREPMRVRVTDRARKEEVEVPIDGDALRRILVADIGDGNDFPVFPALLDTIEQGDPSILAWFVEKRYNQITGAVSLMPLGMECSSGATEERRREIEHEAKTSLFRDAANILFPAVCSALPPVDLGDAFRAPLVSDVPVLFISGSLDSNAPPYQAEQLRFGMSHATHIVVTNAGHEDMLPDDGVQAAMRDFFAGGDVSSRHIALPAPRFLSIDEARKDRKR